MRGEVRAKRGEWHIKRERCASCRKQRAQGEYSNSAARFARPGVDLQALLTTPDLLLSALFSSDLMGSVGARFVRREKERERASCICFKLLCHQALFAV